jgi:Flp pilus assembly pilin Flp
MEKVTSCIGRAQLRITALRDQEEGQALVEYALLLSLIAIVSVVILRSLGLQVANIFSSVNTQI